MSLDENFFFSQHALNIFKVCPIRFQKRYIEGLFWNNVQLDDRNNMERGKNFHVLADRYFSDVSLRMEFFEEYGELNDWIDALREYVPRSTGEYYPEYRIKIDDGGMKLQAKYDLLYIDDESRVTIYDWKTHRKAINYGDVIDSLQTRVYRYVMCYGGYRLTGDEIAPEDITMKYWQPEFPEREIELSYSMEQFEEDGRFLKNLVETIESFDYDSYDKLRSAKHCQRCEFNYFCNTDKVEYSSIFLEEEIELGDWDDIDDIFF